MSKAAVARMFLMSVDGISFRVAGVAVGVVVLLVEYDTLGSSLSVVVVAAGDVDVM